MDVMNNQRKSISGATFRTQKIWIRIQESKINADPSGSGSGKKNKLMLLNNLGGEKPVSTNLNACRVTHGGLQRLLQLP
jgi:hypothetical protein